MKNGLKVAAIYGFKPHQLGFCGSQSKQNVLLNYIKNKKDISDKKAREVLETFEAAYPYYKLIAKSNNIEDPFDEKVVRAYWIGNELLDDVKISDLREMILREFSKPGLLPQEIAVQKAKLIPENSKPHHSFHVLVIGAITGNPMPKDICRPCWGKVKKFDVRSSKLEVMYPPLVGKKILKLGRPVKKIIDWNKELMPDIKTGDWVSFHWNQAVEVLSDKDRKNLEKYTKLTLKNLRK